jgi:Rv0078B-related antitoxin
MIGPNDTTPEAAAIQSRVIGQMTVARRLELAFEMSELARSLARARLREQHADWNETELDREMLRLAFLPDDLPPGF